MAENSDAGEKLKGNLKYNALLKTCIPFTSLVTEKTPYSLLIWLTAFIILFLRLTFKS